MVQYRLNAGVGIVYFVILLKFRRKITKESMTNVSQILKLLEKEEGVNIHGLYWTLGRYDGVIIAEAPNEKVAMDALIRYGEFVTSETLIAVSAEEPGKPIE